MRNRSMIAIILVLLVAAPTLAQSEGPPWDLRAYLSTYTDDASGDRLTTPTTSTWTWNYTAVRHRYVCPYCGYSTSVPNPDPGQPYTCPDPWGVHTDDQDLVPAAPRDRVLSYLGVRAADLDGDNLTDGTLSNDYALVGRPFRPGGMSTPRSIVDDTDHVGWDAAPSPWETPDPSNNEEFAPEDVGSWMTLRAAGLPTALVDGDGDATNDAPNDPDDGLRFLVIEPGSVRASADYEYIQWNGTEDEVSPNAVFYTTAGGDTGNYDASAYSISINPYRVSDGDTYIIRHHEETRQQGGGPNPNYRTQDLDIHVYSTLYGKEFDTGTHLNQGLRATYHDENGCVIITDSGALRIAIPAQYGNEEGENTWVLKIRIRSNTTTLPSPQEVDYDDVDYDKDDKQNIYNDEDEPDLITNINTDMSDFKQPYIAAHGTRSPAVATADDRDDEDYPVAEKYANGGFVTSEAWPYRMPPEAAGRGRVLLQWSDCETSPAWGRESLSNGQDAFYYTGREWHYLVDPDFPDERLVTNEDVAKKTQIADQIPGQTANPTYIDTYFMCSRLDPALTEDTWARWEPDADDIVEVAAAETDTEEATGGQARIIIGDYNDNGVDAAGYGGEYGPGTRTPSRDFAIGNRLPDFVLSGDPPDEIPAQVLVCPVETGGCGARYLNTTLSDGDACPACGVALVAARGEAQLHYDAAEALTAAPDGDVYRMPGEALEFLPGSGLIPMGTTDYPQRVAAQIPPYQPPSVPHGDTFFENDIDGSAAGGSGVGDLGYRGTMVAFNREPVDYEPDTNSAWDAYYLAPGSGEHLHIPGAAEADDVETVCPVCGSRYPNGTSDCGYCGATLDDDGPPLPEGTLTAEEFAPVGVQVSVFREVGLAPDERVVDLGWTAPGTPDDAPNTVNTEATMATWSEPTPTDVSARRDVPVRNEGNIHSVAQMRSGLLFRTEIDPTVRSSGRSAQSVPVSVETLFRYRPFYPDDIAFDDATLTLLRQQNTGAAGERGTSRLQAGVRADTGEAYEGTTKPVPMGQPVGNYAAEVLLFIDLNENGALDFYDAREGATTSQAHEFNPDVDEPFEPVAPFATRMRVVESRVPQSDFYSKDAEPTLLMDDSRDNMQMIWVGQREASGSVGSDAEAGTSSDDLRDPTAPTNLIWSDATLNEPGDWLYRGWLWNPTDGYPDPAQALTVSDSDSEHNASPFAYMDPEDDSRWVMWHRSLTTNAGVSSQLRFDTATDTGWDGSDTDEFVFGSGGAKKGLTGFVRPGAADMHWLLWHAGPEGHETIKYHSEWDPTGDTVPSASNLHLSNSMTGSQFDFFEIAGTRYRKPAQSPFTFARQPSAFGSEDGAGNFEMDVFFTGHIRSLGNSDICWARFDFGDPDNAEFPLNGLGDNYGKQPFPNCANPTFADPNPGNDARGMPAIRDADGDIRGYAGDQLQPSPRRQSFQARDIDWRLTYNYQTDPDWLTWLTAPTPKPDLNQYNDARFYVSVITGTDDDLSERIYAVLWEEGSYDRSTGLYTVVPQLVRIVPDFDQLPSNPSPGPPVWHPYEDLPGIGRDDAYSEEIGDTGVYARALLSPRLRADAAELGAWSDTENNAQKWPAVTLQINPASGTLNWSTSLFNPDDPGDQRAVFNENNTPEIADVVMYADYTPFVRRVTTADANDDSPSAFFDVAGSSRLTVFWRRSYGDRDTPHFGRPAFLHRTWTRSIQLGHPPVNATDITQVYDRTAREDLSGYDVVSGADGILTIDTAAGLSPRRIGHRIQVRYEDADDVPRTEQHRVTGWSVETPVPVNNVVGEGPLRVFPEVYQMQDPADNTTYNAARFWLVWSSGRSVYDMRPDGDGGQRVHQATDIYSAVVAPEYSSLIADLEVPRVGP